MEPLLRVNNIYKAFMGNNVLNDVSIELYVGECLALVGENGAGKSTLMKILSGVYKMDSGSIEVKGKKVEITSPKKAQELGISIIHQELNLIPNLTVTQNIFLGREKTTHLQIDEAQMNQEAEVLLSQLGISIQPTVLISQLSVAEQQVVEIAKVLSQDADIIIMDEPTAALSLEETSRLFHIMDNLRAAGKSLIYISHRLEEIYKVAQRICVLRDGKVVENLKTCVPVSTVVESMVGQKIDNYYPKKAFKTGKVVLETRNLSDKRNYFNINIQVREGEVLGIAGLVGAGQIQLARGIYGISKVEEGEIFINGEKYTHLSPRNSISRNLSLVTESRKDEGLILPMSIKENIGLSPWAPVHNFIGVINSLAEKKISEKSIEDYKIKTDSIHKKAVLLSGGNQQKVVLSKILATNPNVILMCEPTRGVDVNGKIDIYNIINYLLENNKAVVLISSEVPEVLGMSDRIAVMYKGKIVFETKNEGITQEKIMFYATGGYQHG
ncbi:sugar ABC transporter ATP-binding protein [Petroclostridium sp. X23]|uniref:sugar ABC transporter ATP-binding protein n=1 Tax=Petroclostridium sp. X23 TaxID=3045146 RepID=UPI0024ADEEF2|nr:sugar ABC transporter ATP-binding protein [Petroclostridium sp. X23]WHH56826.1 sugar ABC transporter ATP-binding protein [Petroclostridium sp. X23]